MDATPHPSLMITNKWVTQKQNGLPTCVMRLNKKSLFLHIIACNTSVAFSDFFCYYTLSFHLLTFKQSYENILYFQTCYILCCCPKGAFFFTTFSGVHNKSGFAFGA